jgi:serine/threonine protein phosphatase PrpC
VGWRNSVPAVSSVITCFGETHIGLKRKRNEDSYICSPEQGLWLIADGMGGHAAGDIASSIVANQIAEAHAKGIPIAGTLSIARQSMADAVKVGQGAAGMGSTVVVLVLIEDKYEITWVGDSRAYIWSEKSLVQITRDHTFVQTLVDQGVITEEEAFFHPQANVLERAMGPQVEEALADRVSNSLSPGERLLLCSDGLSSHVPHNDIENVFVECMDDRTTIQKLINLALVYGGRDNITAIVVSNSLNVGSS